MDKKSKNIIITAGACIIGLLIIGLIIYLISNINTKKLICEATDGNITIKYDKEKIRSFKSKNVNFDINEQNDYVKQIGIDKFIQEYSIFFRLNYDGNCR